MTLLMQLLELPPALPYLQRSRRVKSRHQAAAQGCSLGDACHALCRCMAKAGGMGSG